MPMMGPPTPPLDPAIQKWQKVLETCLHRRIRADELVGPLRLLSQRYRASSDDVADILVGMRATGAGADDPLLLSYLEELSTLKYIGGGSILLALLRHSRCLDHTRPEDDQKGPPSPAFEESVFTLLQRKYVKAIATGVSGASWKAHTFIYSVTKWLNACVDYETAMHFQAIGIHATEARSLAMYEALGQLAVTVLGSATIREVAKQPWWEQKRLTVVSAMKNFATILSQWMHSRVAHQLQALTMMPPFVETSEDGLPVFSTDQILNSITEIPQITSRAGLYVWLNALLCARPLTDDFNVLNYLQIRYNGGTDSLVVDLLLASFDNLTNSLLHKEFRMGDELIRSFICNKLSGLLDTLHTPATVEQCIQIAFTAISMDPLPPLSQNSSHVRDVLTITRLEFLQGCALYRLISEGTIAAILNEPPMALPRVPKLTDESVVTQCRTNPSRVESFVEDLDGMQGNAGAIASALVQLINTYCANKDTMSLKSLCGILSRRIARMDIIMQYTTPTSLLLPLCNLLDNWTHDEDQSEYQPPYEEFANILLLTLATMRRYDISPESIGVLDSNSFMAKLLAQSGNALRPDQLTDEQSKQLAKWIQGLYATDEHGETAGIGDEVMSHCPPQAFYLLVPTLFEQSVQACRTKALSLPTFLGGLELLLEPFLLPSLLGGLSWLVKRSWEDHKDGEILLQVLQKLLRPASSSQETQAMHKTILTMIADPLYVSLKDLTRRMPNRKDVGNLVEAVRRYTDRQRTNIANTVEIVQWKQDGGVGRNLRKSIADLAAWAWAATNGDTSPPPAYIHRLFNTATNVLGAETVLHIIALELRHQTLAGRGEYAYDAAVAMICTATPERSSPTLAMDGTTHHMSNTCHDVRGVLQRVMSDSQTMSDMKFEDVEALVRLNRRVEAQLTVTQMPQLTVQMTGMADITDDIMQNLDMDGTSADLGSENGNQRGGDVQPIPPDLTANDIAAVMAQSLDMSNTGVDNLASLADGDPMQMDQGQDFFGNMNFDLTQQEQIVDGSGFNAHSNVVNQNQEDDIFADLDMGDMGDFNFA